VQAIDVPKKFTKTKYTSLVVELFEDFLAALRMLTTDFEISIPALDL